MPFIQKLKHSLKKHHLLQMGDKVLLAVSGGADSLALLFSLNTLKDFFGLRLHIAHLDHMLRKNSYQDLLYVKSIADKLGISFSSKRINLKKIAKKASLEEVARDARLDFLIKTAKAIKADKIALGHTKDDQSETVLMRIIRGCGLQGLSSILPIRNIRGFTFIRPLIDIERKDIEQFLKKLKIKPRLDTTNFETKFLRNKIRNELLPILKDYNPNIKESLARLAEISLLDYELIEKLGKSSLKNCGCRLSGKSLVLDLRKFLELPKSLQKMVLRLGIKNLIGTTRRLTYKHWEEMEHLIYNCKSGSMVNLPRQISLSKQKGKIVLTLRNS